MTARLPTETLDALKRAIEAGLRPLKADPPVAYSTWAAEHFDLDEESSHQRGLFVPWPFQIGWMDAFSNDDIEEVNVEKAKRVGYALALDTPVPTPSGWTTMGRLAPGDTVFDEAGRPCIVRYCSPIYRNHTCYRITFCDGTQVVADEGHRWMVESRVSFEYLLSPSQSRPFGRPPRGRQVTTQGILDTGQMARIQSQGWSYNQLRIRNAAALELPNADLPIPPYTLGLWLGDGHLVTPRITQHRGDVETADHIRAEGIDARVCYLDQRNPNNATILLDVGDEPRAVTPWAARFRALGLLSSKHIPPIYLRASRNQRLQLLRGLMDSDGTVGTNGRCEFVSTNKALADGVYELVVSLGLKATLRGRMRQQAHHLDQYRVNFKPSPAINPFNLQRKAHRVIEVQRPTITYCRRVVSVQPIASVPVRCIEVDSPSHLFLCTRAMVPTHNTKTVVGFAEYNAAHRRRKLAIWQPTDDDRDSFVKSEITPSFDICRGLDPVRRLGRDDDTIKFKRFRGSVQHYLGAKAARSFRRITIAVAILDEVDAMDQVVEKTIDPVTGAKGRLEGAPFPKIILGTTPRHKLTSHVRRRVQAAEAVMEFRIDCPHCELDHPLMWGGADVRHGFKWDNADPATVRHVCPHCNEPITQADYLTIWQAGRWVSRCGDYLYNHTAKVWTDSRGTPRKPPRHVAFVNVWTAYSPQRAWPDIVREFLEARKAQKLGDSGPMQGFKNETLADVWEEEYDHTDASLLRARALSDIDIPLQLVPQGACKILLGIDTQQDRWEAVAWAIGEGEEMWPIDYRVIYGNPAQQQEWFEKLNPVIEATYRHINGHAMPIDAVGIDTGGTNWTHQAYTYCRAMNARKVFATKGDQALGAPIKMKPSWVDVNAFGKTLKRGVKLWRICVDTAKDLLHGRLDQVKQPGPGYIHLNRHLPPEWFDQLTAEHRIKVRMAHGWADRWVCPSGHRNEVLDCTVIVLFLAQAMGYHTTPASTWQKWRDALAPDLFSAPAPSQAHPEAPQAPVQPPRAQPAVPVAPSATDLTTSDADDELFAPIPMH